VEADGGVNKRRDVREGHTEVRAVLCEKDLAPLGEKAAAYHVARAEARAVLLAALRVDVPPPVVPVVCTRAREEEDARTR
jgi:hypothetical protein